MNATGLIGTSIRLTDSDEQAGLCADLLIDSADGRIPYLLLDLGAGAGRTPVIVSTDRAALTADGFVLDAGADEVASWRRGVDADVPAGPVDLSALPPVVIGPFGHALAPAMAGAVFNAFGTSDALARPDIDQTRPNWHWLANLLGKPVFSETGRLGALEEITVAPEPLACVTLLVADDDGAGRAFGFSKLRKVARGDESLVLELTDPPPYSAERIAQERGGGGA